MSAQSVRFALGERGTSSLRHPSVVQSIAAGTYTDDAFHVSSRLLCANNAGSSSAPACVNTGTRNCRKVSKTDPDLSKATLIAREQQCRLVKYCGEGCQTAHWPLHRRDCRHPQLKADWQPAWVNENRTPEFMGGPPVAQFGYKANERATYVWGNVAAIDCLNVAANEGLSASTTNFKLCFAGKPVIPIPRCPFLITLQHPGIFAIWCER